MYITQISTTIKLRGVMTNPKIEQSNRTDPLKIEPKKKNSKPNKFSPGMGCASVKPNHTELSHI